MCLDWTPVNLGQLPVDTEYDRSGCHSERPGRGNKVHSHLIDLIFTDNTGINGSHGKLKVKQAILWSSQDQLTAYQTLPNIVNKLLSFSGVIQDTLYIIYSM